MGNLNYSSAKDQGEKMTLIAARSIQDDASLESETDFKARVSQKSRLTNHLCLGLWMASGEEPRIWFVKD